MRHVLLTLPLFLLAVPIAAQTERPLALRGLDPVALCEGEEIDGSPDLVLDWGRHRYCFVDEASLATFRADPQRWGIQWGGACGRMGPLSGRGSPDRWAVHDGRIYVFASDGCRDGFLSAPERFVVAPAPFPDASAEELAEGQRWIEKAVAAHGGAEAIDARRALHLVSRREQDGWSGVHEILATAAGEVRRTSSWTPSQEGQPGYTTVWVAAGDAFSVEDGEVFDTKSEEERRDLERFAHREPLFLLWERKRAGFRAAHAGEGVLVSDTVVDVAVELDGLVTTLHLDPETARIRGLSWTGRPNDGITHAVTETFTEWRTVDGVVVPAARAVTVDGMPSESMSGAWETIELTSTIEPGAFERP